jgi:hypothetical protein
VRSRRSFLAGLLPILVISSSAWAQAPLPILRGIVLPQNGEGRAYFEDPRTGALAAYASGDLVGDSRIEEIHEARVVLRRGSELVQVLMGASSSTVASETEETAGPSPRVTASTPVPPPAPVFRPNPTGGPTIGNGQPWLDRLGIPPQALSRAIEQALPAQDPDSDNIKD